MTLPVNNTDLMAQLRTTLNQINQQVEAIRVLAFEQEVEPFKLMDAHGVPLLSEMLHAKAQCLAAIIQLQVHQSAIRNRPR